MMFNDLSPGDTFESKGLKYIKISLVIDNFGDGHINKANAVCIDEYSDQKGKLKFFNPRILVSHVNYS